MLSWNEIIQNYIVKFSNKTQKTTQPLRDHFGIGYFTYHRIDDSGKYTVLVDRPDWAEHYVSSQIYLNDPYLRHPSVYQSGIALIESNGSNEYKANLIKSGKQVLNVDLGVILIQKSKSYVEFFGFAGNRGTSSLEKVYLNHSHILTSFAQHFKSEVHPILNKMEDEAGSLLELKGADFHCKQVIGPDVSVDTFRAFYEDLGMAGLVKRAEKLSLRERQCLRYLLDGKSAKETASDLKLSHRTVEFYFENIKNKLNCWSKQEVFKIAQKLDQFRIL